MKKIISSVLLLSSVFSGCSKSSSSGGDSPSVVRYNSFSSTPIFLRSQAEFCADDGNQKISTTYSISLLKNGYNYEEDLSIGQILDMQYIRSKYAGIVSATYKNQETSKEYDLYWNNESQDYREKYLVNSEKINEGEAVILCSSINKLKDDSIETASVKVNYFIDKTNKAIKSLNLGIDIRPIEVFISPKHKSKYSAYKDDQKVLTLDNVYETDNAYYHPIYETITFLPQSEEGLKKDLFGGIGLWNIGMVPSHEYGHHIFNSIVKSYSYYDLQKNHDVCFDNRVEKGSKFGSEKKINAYRNSDHHTTIGALNEGFADLISFYTLEDNERTLTNITCMEKSRDVGSRFFADGTPKKFTVAAVKLMESSEVDDTKRDCTQPDFQEIHSIGAVFASMVDDMLSRFTTDKSIKLKVTLNWLKLLEKDYKKRIRGYTTQTGLEYAYEMFISEILKEFNMQATTEVCQKIEEDFQTIDSNMLGAYIDCP